MTRHKHTEWVSPSKWHIDDVKLAIQDSEYADRPMPSDEELVDYLKDIVRNDYYVELMNEAIAHNLGDLF